MYFIIIITDIGTEVISLLLLYAKLLNQFPKKNYKSELDNRGLFHKKISRRNGIKWTRTLNKVTIDYHRWFQGDSFEIVNCFWDICVNTRGCRMKKTFVLHCWNVGNCSDGWLHLSFVRNARSWGRVLMLSPGILCAAAGNCARRRWRGPTKRPSTREDRSK